MKRPPDAATVHTRRPRYQGKNPRAFHEKYKELNPERYASEVQKILASGKLCGERVDRGGDPRGIEAFVGLRLGLGHNAIHDLPRYRTALTLSRDILG